MPDQHAPEQINPQSLNDYLEVMSKTLFQTGISWRVVESKWPGTREALQGFDVYVIANFTPEDLDELTRDTRLIRNRRKIEAVVGNAQRMLELEEQHGSFQAYLRSHGGFEGALKDLRKQFKFMGDMGGYYFLFVVGEKVPPYEEWCASRSVATAAR